MNSIESHPTISGVYELDEVSKRHRAVVKLQSYQGRHRVHDGMHPMRINFRASQCRVRKGKSTEIDLDKTVQSVIRQINKQIARTNSGSE